MSPPGTRFTDESNEEMRIKCLDQGHNILMLPGFVPLTSGSRNRHPNHMPNMLLNVKCKEESSTKRYMKNACIVVLGLFFHTVMEAHKKGLINGELFVLLIQFSAW